MCPDFQKKVIGRGAAYIYIESITSLVSGYIFWLIVSRITTSEVIGTSSTVITYATIVASIAGMGIATGIQRFLGKNLSENNIKEAKKYFINSLVLISIGLFVSIVTILATQNWIQSTFGFDLSLIMISILLIMSINTTMLFRSAVISSLKTGSLPLIFITSSATKLIVTIILLLIGMGSVGLTLGYTLNHVLSSGMLALLLMRTVFKQEKFSDVFINFKNYSRKILISSWVNWIPMLVITVGSQLGTIVVFGSQGANQAGIYFLALTIVSGITSIMNSLFSIALPTLSGLTDSRKRIAWQTIRLSTIIILPFSCSLIFYSNEIMGLFGQAYRDGAISLEILLLSMLPMCVISGVTALLNSYGKYREVLTIGLALSIPQTVLYLVLVPTYGGIGASMAYTIGSVIGCLASMTIAGRIGLLLFWKDLIILFMIPTTIGFILNSLHINYILGIIITILISYILFMKMKVVTITDIHDFMDVLPEKVSHAVLNMIEKYRDRKKGQ